MWWHTRWRAAWFSWMSSGRTGTSLVMSNFHVLVVMDVVLAPATQAVAAAAEVVEEPDLVDPLGPLESHLGLHPQPQRRTGLDRQRHSVHLIGQDGLRLVGEVAVDRPVEMPRSI